MISPSRKNRIPAIDEIRGFCVICMVIYHLCFVLRFSYDVDIPLLFDGWFVAVQQSFAGVFILISGIVCNFSRNNLRRGALCLLAATLVSSVTAIAVPSAPVYFGILHCLAFCMLLYGLFGDALSSLPWLPAAAVCCVLFALTVCLPLTDSVGIPPLSLRLPDALYDTVLLMPLGIIPPEVSTIDYFPLIPWLFLFAAGSFIGIYIRKKTENKRFRVHIPPLAFVGRHALVIYLAHQPLIILILSLFMKQKNVFIL